MPHDRLQRRKIYIVAAIDFLMLKRRGLFSVVLLLILIVGTFVYAEGTSTNNAPAATANAQTGVSLTAVGTKAMQYCAVQFKDDRVARIRCRLDAEAIKMREMKSARKTAVEIETTTDDDEKYNSEESCAKLPMVIGMNVTNSTNSTNVKPRLTKGICQALYASAKVCYMQREKSTGSDSDKKTFEECLQRNAGLQKKVSEEATNKDGVRKYLVLRLYNLQQKVEKASQDGKITSDDAATTIDLIVKIKADIMGGSTKAEIKDEVEQLKKKIRAMKLTAQENADASATDSSTVGGAQ